MGKLQKNMLFLFSFGLRLLPFYLLNQFQKKFGHFNLNKFVVYSIVTSLYYGFLSSLMIFVYSHIYDIGWYDRFHYISHLILHLFVGLIIAILFLLSIKYKSSNPDTISLLSGFFLYAGLALAALLKLYGEFLALLLPL